MRDFVLKLHCHDRPGILAAVTGALAAHGGDIRDAHSFGDEGTGEFFIRIHLHLPASGLPGLESALCGLAADLDLRWELHDRSVRSRVAILVSKFDHCLIDLLQRAKRGALDIEIPLVISNHETARAVVEWHDVPFVHLPVSADTKSEQESALLEALTEHRIDLVVLARYMQILSPDLCQVLAGRCINIHHSFLPGFKGARPYQQAYDRGVKLIGATAHYVTEDLDEGPIIEQEVRRVTHATSAAEMAAMGREIEASVLARAVRWHVEHRVVLHGVKTVVFA